MHHQPLLAGFGFVGSLGRFLVFFPDVFFKVLAAALASFAALYAARWAASRAASFASVVFFVVCIVGGVVVSSRISCVESASNGVVGASMNDRLVIRDSKKLKSARKFARLSSFPFSQFSRTAYPGGEIFKAKKQRTPKGKLNADYRYNRELFKGLGQERKGETLCFTGSSRLCSLLVGWLTGWLIGCLHACWVSEWVGGCVVCLVNWLINGLVVKAVGCFVGRLFGRLTEG